MLISVFNILVIVILVEALTELSKAYITFPLWNLILRLTQRIPKLNEYMQYLLSCGYCKSVWISLFCCLIAINIQCLPILISIPLLNFFLIVLLVHRFSNLWHFLIDRVDTRNDVRYNKKD